MGFLKNLFGRPDPSSVMKMSGPPTAFMSNISHRKFWKKIPQRLLDAIARNAGEVFRDFTDNHVRIDNEMHLLKSFIVLSEQHRLVDGNFIGLASGRYHELSPPLSAFSFTLYRVGSGICQRLPLITDPDECVLMMQRADCAFTSSIVCDPVNLSSYFGMAGLLGGEALPGFVLKEDALGWCRMYKEAEKRLLTTPDEKLGPAERGFKMEMTASPGEAKEMRRHGREIVERLPEVAAMFGGAGDVEDDDMSLRDMIDQLEARLLAMK